ncbi:hypothetical protein [Streptomyces sp. NBC_00847]|uniref:zinc finger domain-containing protein n=1 Tax=unclassified Streptomyces TaxID=2593676 RepID=UPI00224EB8F4|nr:hypothetical protein [Streptomyces sp. NBC_00847]MCX4881388.1 hypothetical protein [Streptomyces sp. NBC_00847]
MSTCQAPAGSPCKTTAGKVTLQYHTARFQLVPALRSELHIATPAVRHPGSPCAALPAVKSAAAATPMEVSLGHASPPALRGRPV